MDKLVVLPTSGTVTLISTGEGWKTLAEAKEILKAETVRVVKKPDGAYVLERKIKDSLGNDCWLEARMPIDGVKDLYSKMIMDSLFKALEAAQEKAEAAEKKAESTEYEIGSRILATLGHQAGKYAKFALKDISYIKGACEEVFTIRVKSWAGLGCGGRWVDGASEWKAPDQEFGERVKRVVDEHGAALVRSIGKEKTSAEVSIEGVCYREVSPYGAVKTERVGNAPKIDLVAEFRHAEADDQAEEKQYARLGREIRRKVDQDGVVTVSKAYVGGKIDRRTTSVYELNTNRGCHTTFGFLHS